MFQKIIRLSSFIVGLLLFIIVLPHRDPWNSTNITTAGKVYENITIQIPLIKYPITTSGAYIFLFELFLLVIMLAISQSAKRYLLDVLKNPRSLIHTIISILVFLFTLFPTKDGLPIILYLTLSGIGVLYMIFGLYPILILLYTESRKLRLSYIADQFYSLESRYFVIFIFAVPFILTNICSYFIFEHVPHIQDNIDQVFHAKIFLKGHLTVPSHQYREFFDFTHNINNGKWYSEYPPGHTFMIMLGLLAGIPWAINPLLGSGAVVLFYYIGREIFGEKVGRLSSLLGILSPFIVFMSSEFFSHATALFFISLFVLFFIKTVIWQSSQRFKAILHAMIAGASMGVCFNARMMTALGVSIPYAIYAIYLTIKSPKTYLTRFSVMLLCFLMFLGILLTFNYFTNGDPLLFGYEVLHGKQHNPGFGHSAWGEPHTPLKGLTQNLNDFNALNKYLFEWCIPSTFFVMLFFMGGKRTRWDYILVASVFSLSSAYFFYWYQGWCFGPRFAYESSLPLIMLTARGILSAPDFLAKFGNKETASRNAGFIINFTVVLCIIIALIVNVPVLIKHYSNDYWGVSADVQRTIKRKKIGNAVVFVGSYYGSVLAENSPLLDSDVIYVRDLGEKNILMMRYYPDKKYYLANGKNIDEIADYYFQSGEPIFDNSDFEKGDFDGWKASGDAWGVTDRQRDNKTGKFHAESLVGGEKATGILKSGIFRIDGRLIKFLKNGWNRDPDRPNQYFLRDAETDEILRTASPPDHDPFATHFWNILDLAGHEVYIEVIDNDDDTLQKGGFAWIGIDDITQIK